jgi:hypothetical protein
MDLVMHLLPLLVVLVQQEADAEQVVLLDTTGEPTLDWTRYPYGPQANTPGVSFYDSSKSILRLARFHHFSRIRLHHQDKIFFNRNICWFSSYCDDCDKKKLVSVLCYYLFILDYLVHPARYYPANYLYVYVQPGTGL